MYTTVQAMRAEGLGVAQASDVTVTAMILRAQELIDRVTGLWFEPRSQLLELDGDACTTFFLAIPIISIASIAVGGDAIDLATVAIYNRHITRGVTSPDDRANPRIVRRNGVWPAGRLNVEVDGVFGWTEPDQTTPLSVQRACQILVFRDVEPIASPDRVASRRQGDIRSESTRDQSVTYGSFGSFGGAPQFGSTGDAEADMLLSKFRRPVGLEAL